MDLFVSVNTRNTFDETKWFFSVFNIHFKRGLRISGWQCFNVSVKKMLSNSHNSSSKWGKVFQVFFIATRSKSSTILGMYEKMIILVNTLIK